INRSRQVRGSDRVTWPCDVRRVVSKRGMVLRVAVKTASRGAVHKTTEASSARRAKVDYHLGLRGLRLPTRGILAGCPQHPFKFRAATLVAALLLAEQVADLGEQLDVGGSGGAGLLA